MKEKIQKIILDTNTLLAIGKFNLDIFAALDDACDFAYRLYVLDGTLEELDKLIDEERGKERDAALLGKRILKQRIGKGMVEVLDDFYPKKDVDSNLAYASSKKYLVLTQDKELKGRLTKPYLTIRQKSFVAMIGAQYF